MNYLIIESVKSIGDSYTRVFGSHSHKNLKTVWTLSQTNHDTPITFVVKFITIFLETTEIANFFFW